jgi:hypothetical protein
MPSMLPSHGIVRALQDENPFQLAQVARRCHSLAALAVKLLTVALATATGGGTPLDLLARVPASVADLGAALLVFEALRAPAAPPAGRPLGHPGRGQPALFVASRIHGDPVGVAVAPLLLAVYLLVDRDAPLVAGITLALASRVAPMALLVVPVAVVAVASGAVATGTTGEAGGRRAYPTGVLVHFGGALVGVLFAVWVPTLAWDWDSLATAPSGEGGPGGLGPGWVLARSLDQGVAGWLLGSGRPLVLAAAVLPAVIWMRRRPRRVYAAVGLLLLVPLALGPAWLPRDLVWPAMFGYLGDARWASTYAVAAGATLLWTSTWWGAGVPWDDGVAPAPSPMGRWPAWSPGWSLAPGRSSAGARSPWEAGAGGSGAGGAGGVDDRAPVAAGSAMLPRGVGSGPGGFGAPANGSAANGSIPDDPDPGGASPSRRSVGVPK